MNEVEELSYRAYPEIIIEWNSIVQKNVGWLMMDAFKDQAINILQ